MPDVRTVCGSNWSLEVTPETKQYQSGCLLAVSAREFVDSGSWTVTSSMANLITVDTFHEDTVRKLTRLFSTSASSVTKFCLIGQIDV